MIISLAFLLVRVAWLVYRLCRLVAFLLIGSVVLMIRSGAKLIKK
jgi:hypothetical protein